MLLNNVDIRTYNRRDYYQLFSAVFQDFSVLDVTIAENIAQTDENIDRSLMEQCIKQAGLKEKIAGLPMGLETHIGKVFEDGIHLSGGELQRLMLARALYKNAPIIVLDEPTSALDPIAERDIYHQYNELTDGKMAVYISHRLASTRFCDRIILIADGSIDEEGTHEELIAQNGHYAQLFEIQGAINALTPYVGIWLFARLIDEIAGKRNPQTLTEYALALMITTVVLSLLGAGLTRWRNVQFACLWHTQNKVFNEKLLSMDFVDADDGRVQELRSCRFCQDIAVFHEGRLTQRGSHDALVSDKSGMYYKLWDAQAQYYMNHT